MFDAWEGDVSSGCDFFSDSQNRDCTGVRAVIAAAGDLYLKVTCGGDYSMPRACVTDDFAARVGKTRKRPDYIYIYVYYNMVI